MTDAQLQDMAVAIAHGSNSAFCRLQRFNSIGLLLAPCVLKVNRDRDINASVSQRGDGKAIIRVNMGLVVAAMEMCDYLLFRHHRRFRLPRWIMATCGVRRWSARLKHQIESAFVQLFVDSVICHELGHVLGDHIAIGKQFGLQRIQHESYSSSSGALLDEKQCLVSRSLETDADQLGAFLFGLYAAAISNSGSLPEGLNAQATYELGVIAMMSIFYSFARNQAGHGAPTPTRSRTHPHPWTRLNIVSPYPYNDVGSPYDADIGTGTSFRPVDMYFAGMFWEVPDVFEIVQDVVRTSPRHRGKPIAFGDLGENGKITQELEPLFETHRKLPNVFRSIMGYSPSHRRTADLQNTGNSA